MTNYLTTLLMCFALAGSAYAQEPPTADATAEPVADREQWDPYFEPMLLKHVAGKKGTETVTLRRAFILHRKSFEQISVLGSDLESCTRDLGACEQREVERATAPPFWDSTLGTVLKVGLGFAAGVGVTIGIVYAVAPPG